MKITEREAKIYIDMASQWKLGNVKKDDIGMPIECTLYQESNPYLPRKVKMTFQEECDADS